MRPIDRKRTLAGIGTDATYAPQLDAKVPAPAPRGVTCRPGAVASPDAPARYSYVAPRRLTLSMPIPSGDHAAARRRQTAMMPSFDDEAARQARAS